jgi:hypothetical protein
MKKISLIIIIILTFTLTSCLGPKRRAYDVSVESLKTKYTISSVDPYSPDNVDEYEDYYRVDVFYEAKSNAGTLRRYSSTCRVKKDFSRPSCS